MSSNGAFTGTFQKLFRIAEKECGLFQPVDVQQSDTSEFDRIGEPVADEDDGPTSQNAPDKKIVIEDPEINSLRNTIRHFPREKQLHAAVVKFGSRKLLVVEQKAKKSNGSAVESFAIPVIDWESEVRDMMRADDDDTLDKQSEEEEDEEEELEAANETKMEVDGEGEKSDVKKKSQSLKTIAKARGVNSNNNNNIWSTPVLPMPYIRRLTLPEVLATSSCFEPDVIDLSDPSSNLVDPLDVLIPNPVLPKFDSQDSDVLDPLREDDDETATDNEHIEDCDRFADIFGSALALPQALGGAGSTAGGGAAAAAGGGAGTAGGASLLPVSRAERNFLMQQEKLLRISEVAVGFDARASINRGKRPRDDQTLSRARVRSTVAALNHSTIAATHKNTKMDLTEGELRFYHRPRLVPRFKQTPWQIVLEDIRGKTLDNNPGGGAAAVRRGTFRDLDKQDISLLSGGNFIVLEYIEERPPVMMNLGMASALVNYYRSVDQRDQEEKRQRQKEETAERLSMINTCRMPRHVRLLLQQRDKKQAYDHDANVPRIDIGETRVLNPDDESPFLGQIAEGELQQAVTNNLFRCPIFRQEPSTTDFLLIRHSMNKIISYRIREIPRIFVCGQQEPQKIVERPKATMTSLQEKMIMLAVSRVLVASLDSTFKDLQKSILNYCRRKRQIKDSGLKRAIGAVAEEFTDGAEGKKWRSKDIPDFSPEELQKTFTPEDVCLQESCNAGELKLALAGIEDIELPRIEQWLRRMQNFKEFQEERKAFVLRLAVQFRRTSRGPALERLVKILKDDIKRLSERMKVGRFIFERLAMAPWNTTQAYVRSHLEDDGLGRMALQGVGDPSGRGEGFAFVRLVDSAAPQKKAKNARLYNTEADLRKLTKADAVTILTSMGYDKNTARAMKRWDRVLIIREMATQSKNMGISNLLHKYARVEAASVTSMTQKNFSETSQQIFQRQKDALSQTARSVTTAAATAGGKLGGEDGRSTGGEVGSSNNKGKGGQDVEGEDDDDDTDNDDEDDFFTSIAERGRRSVDELSSSSMLPYNNKGPSLSTSIEDDKRELNSLVSSLAGAAAAGAKAGGPASDNTGATGATAGAGADATSSSLFGPHRERPSQVVKRLVRTVFDDGTEVIRVQFVLSEKEVTRVTHATARARRDREERKDGAMFADISGGLGGLLDEEEERGHIAAASNKMTFKIGKMAKEARKSRGDFSVGGVEIEAEEYRPTKSTARAAPLRNYRLPHISFAGRLEKELMAVWRAKYAADFRAPVPRNIDGYYEAIKDPICLEDIRTKISEYKYLTANDFLSDVQLMVDNCRTFNGKDSPFTKNAVKISSVLQSAMSHERKHFGIDRDTIHILEEAIKKKFVYLKRTSVLGAAALGAMPSSSSSNGGAPIHHAASAPVIKTEPSSSLGVGMIRGASSAVTLGDAGQAAAALGVVPRPAKTSKSLTDFDEDSSGDEEVLEEG